MDCVVTPLKTLMGFSVHLNVQVKFYNLPFIFQNSGNGGFVFIINGTVMLFYTMIMTPLVMKGIKNEEKYAEK
ncbi:hypothetical protein ACI3EJ_10430 [Ligilactobacillus acidipiscis]|jgi:hypothetical protein|uniref:hypothetical protein n=1 Tax=Ligilactobacillus acidipiscis TaxID=89059 RepID=UPI0029FC8388|nr:hypothetical protein [Ligilactobacillus acidipiscis]